MSGVRADAQRRRAGRRSALGPLRRGEPQARAGVRALRTVLVRRRSCLADLAARAPAFVDQPLPVQALERGLVELDSLGLAHYVAVPVDAERGEVVKLLLLEVTADAAGVEVLHPDEEARVAAAGEQPGEEGGPEVPQVQRPGRARRESTVGVHVVHGSLSAPHGRRPVRQRNARSAAAVRALPRHGADRVAPGRLGADGHVSVVRGHWTRHSRSRRPSALEESRR